MALIHRVHTADTLDIGWTFVAGANGHIAEGDTIASATSVKAYDRDTGLEVDTIFSSSPAPSVDNDALTVMARLAISGITEDVTLAVEVIAVTTAGRTVVYKDASGGLPLLYINATP